MIRKQVYNSSTLQTTTDYIDGFVYITQGTGSPLISYFPMPEGRVLNTSSSGVTLVKEFIVTDQQGNARVSFRDGGSGTPVVYQENSYYGFGLVLPNSPVGTTATSNKQLYNGGSEWQNDYSNLPDYYQTYYRNYDAALARWVGVDPMAESAESTSIYHYSGNNPIMYNDPLGNLLNPAKMLRPTQGNATDNVNMQFIGRLNNNLASRFEDDSNNLGANDAGLYYSDPGAYWDTYSASGGFFGGTTYKVTALEDDPNADAKNPNAGNTTGTGSGGTGYFVDYDLGGNIRSFIPKNNGDNFNSFSIDYESGTGESGILNANAKISYATAMALISNNQTLGGLQDDHGEGVDLLTAANQGGGSNDRGPDYYNVNISVGIPITGNIIGVNESISFDRYGNDHISLPGISVGKSLSQTSFSVTANWLMQNQMPSEKQLNNFLTGNSYNASSGAIFGGTATYSPGNGGYSTGTGYFTPQVGISWNYTPSWGFLNPQTNIKW